MRILKKIFSFKSIITVLLIAIGIASSVMVYQIYLFTIEAQISDIKKAGIKIDEFNNEIYKYKFLADIKEASKQSQLDYNVKPSIMMSQAILESDWGRSDLAKDYNNLFGIKGFTKGKTVNMQTTEFEKGIEKVKYEDFETFSSQGESIMKHAELLTKGTKEDPDRYKKVIEAKDYKDAAIQLQLAGYASDPEYANKLIQIIEQFNLNKYDK